MDIAIIGKNSIKIKGKQVTLIVDPSADMPKTASDAVVLLNGTENTDVSRVTDSRIVISGPGGYEVGGAKISGINTPKGILYKLSVDDVNIILGSSVDKEIEGFDVCDIAIVNTNNDFNEVFVTALEPKMTILYGDQKTESAKKLGAENLSSVPKISVTKDKFPEKMEIAILG